MSDQNVMVFALLAVLAAFSLMTVIVLSQIKKLLADLAADVQWGVFGAAGSGLLGGIPAEEQLIPFDFEGAREHARIVSKKLGNNLPELRRYLVMLQEFQPGFQWELEIIEHDQRGAVHVTERSDGV